MQELRNHHQQSNKKNEKKIESQNYVNTRITVTRTSEENEPQNSAAVVAGSVEPKTFIPIRVAIVIIIIVIVIKISIFIIVFLFWAIRLFMAMFATIITPSFEIVGCGSLFFFFIGFIIVVFFVLPLFKNTFEFKGETILNIINRDRFAFIKFFFNETDFRGVTFGYCIQNF